MEKDHVNTRNTFEVICIFCTNDTLSILSFYDIF